MGIRRGTTTGGYANAGHACTAGPSSITFSFFFTLSASFSYSHWCPRRAGRGKEKAVCSHRASPSSPRWIQHPASALKPQRKQATCTPLFELSPTVATHLSVSSGSCCHPFLNTHRRILYLILIYGLAELLLKFPSPHSPGLISRPYRKKKKKNPVVPPEKGTTRTKTNTNKKSVKITCMLCVTLIGIGGQKPTAVPCGQWSAGVRVQ